MPDVDAIVIGSGAGGLTAAVALAQAGKSVTVFEQHYLPGGWCHSFPLEGYLFSPGVHYIGDLGEGGRMRAIYEGLGLSEHLTFLELNRDGYDHIQIGEERFDVPAGFHRFKESLKNRFPSEKRGIDRYLDVMKAVSDEVSAGVRVKGALDALKVPWKMRNILRYGARSLQGFTNSCVSDPVLQSILMMQSGDHGMGPKNAPVVMHAAIMGHYFEGGWYPQGGARSLPKAYLKQLRRHGGSIKVRTGVDRILIRDGRAVGVRLQDGTEVSSDVVVSNADPGVTWNTLVGREHTPKKVAKRLDNTKWSVSALSLFFAVDDDLAAKGLDSGNYWMNREPSVQHTYDIAQKASLDDVKQLPGGFLTITTLKDRSKRTDGIHVGESFAFVSNEAFQRWSHTHHEQRPNDYASFKARLTDLMWDNIETISPGMRDKAVFENLGTPLTNTHYCASTEGNLYGIEKSLGNLGPMGFPITSPVPGLYQCGQSTMGHGVAGATISGLLAAQAVLGCRQRELLAQNGPTLTTLPADRPDLWPQAEADAAAK